jgi:hypothetical protein
MTDEFLPPFTHWEAPLEKATRTQAANDHDFLEDSLELIAELYKYYGRSFTFRIREVDAGASKREDEGENHNSLSDAEEVLEAVQTHVRRLEDAFLHLPAIATLETILSSLVNQEPRELLEKVEIQWNKVRRQLKKRADEFKTRDAAHDWWQLTNILHDALRWVAARHPNNTALQADLAREFDGFKLVRITATHLEGPSRFSI